MTAKRSFDPASSGSGQSASNERQPPPLFEICDDMEEFDRRRKDWQQRAMSSLFAFADVDRDLARRLCMETAKMARRNRQLFDLLTGHLNKPFEDGSTKPPTWRYPKHVQMVVRYHHLQMGVCNKSGAISRTDALLELGQFFEIYTKDGEIPSTKSTENAYRRSREAVVKKDFLGIEDERVKQRVLNEIEAKTR